MRIVYASLVFGLSLSACQIIGDPKDPWESAGDTVDSDANGTTHANTTSTGTGTSTDGTTQGTDGTTTEAQPTTGVATEGSTVGGTDCPGLDEFTCISTAGCRAVYGTPFDFEGCSPPPAFLGCVEDLDCGQAETVVCRDNSLEVYLLQDTCIPTDFTVCETMLPECGAACLGLDETACGMDPKCFAHLGAPHVMMGDTSCADFNNQQFLACDKLGPPCPPAVVTVCPMGQMDPVFDVSSGCTPPGFEACGDGPLPECP